MQEKVSWLFSTDRNLCLLSVWRHLIKPFYAKHWPSLQKFLYVWNSHERYNQLFLHKYAHSSLKPLSNQLKNVFKQIKPCSNRGIHMLFEHGFYLQILKTGHRTTMQGCLRRFLLMSLSFHSSRNGVKNNKKQNGVNWCLQCTQRDLFHDFLAVFDGSFHGII